MSKLFHHPCILPYRTIFIAENQLWVITPFQAYGKNAVLCVAPFIVCFTYSEGKELGSSHLGDAWQPYCAAGRERGWWLEVQSDRVLLNGGGGRASTP